MNAMIDAPNKPLSALTPATAAQGNESRLTSRLPENLQQVLRIPGGGFSPSFDGFVVGDLAHQIEGEVADHSHVFGAVAGAQWRDARNRHNRDP
jgi:hypothetical protein